MQDELSMTKAPGLSTHPDCTLYFTDVWLHCTATIQVSDDKSILKISY